MTLISWVQFSNFDANKADTGCELRVDKCEIFDLLKVKKGEICIDTLGACIGSKDHRVAFLESKINDLARAILRLKQLPKQHGLLYFVVASQKN